MNNYSLTSRVLRAIKSPSTLPTRVVRFVVTRLDLFPGLRRRRVFEALFQERGWGSSESVSGLGSTLEGTKDVRDALPVLCTELGITTLVDIPCGDFNWMAEMKLAIKKYVGGDIVPELIKANRRNYGGSSRRFDVIDLASDSLPTGDLILVRDCLVHLPNEHVNACLKNIFASDIRYLLTTHYPSVEKNAQCRIGGWRGINLEIAPFNLPPPQKIIADIDYPGEPLREDKHLALWDLDTLRHGKR